MKNNTYRLILVLISIYILLSFFGGFESSAYFCTSCILCVTFACFLFFLHQQKSDLRGWWIRPSNILLIGLLVVNLQYVLDFILGYKPASSFGSIQIVNKCCMLGSIGVMSFIAGNITSNNSFAQQHSAPLSNNMSCTFLYLVQAASFVGWITSVNVVSLVTGASYADDTWGGGMAANFEEIFYDSTMTILVVKALSGLSGSCTKFMEFIKSYSLSFWMFVGLYLLIRIMSGDRGPFIYSVLSIFFTYIIISKKKISLKYVFIAGIAFSSLMIVIGVARGMSFDMAFGEKASAAAQTLGQARFSDATVLTPTEELALSFRCNETAVSEIQRGQDFHYGKYQIYSLLNCIPFMPSFLYNTLKIPLRELSSDYYLTECYFGDYSISGQIGTTVIAEFYLEFGILGVILGMFIVGLFFGKIDRSVCINPANSLGLISIVVTLLFASHSIYIPRSNFLSQLHPIIIIVIMFYTNKLLSRK